MLRSTGIATTLSLPPAPAPAVAVALALALVVGAPAACHPPAGPTVRPLAGLRILCDPADATLYVDDRYLGNAARLGQQPLMLPEGLHRLELRRDGYFAHFAEVTLVNGVRQQLEVKLRKEPF